MRRWPLLITRTNWGYFRRRCYAEGLSKARLSSTVGRRDALAAERAYTRHALPAGIWQGLNAAATQRDPAGLLRAARIVFGLTSTTAGYAVGRMRVAPRRRPAFAAVPSEHDAGRVAEAR